MQHSPPQTDISRRAERHSASKGPSADHLHALYEGIDAMWGVVRQQGLSRFQPAHLRTEVRSVAILARDARVLPENLLSLIKESWSAQPEVRNAADPNGARDQLSGVVTLCIHEYYRE